MPAAHCLYSNRPNQQGTQRSLARKWRIKKLEEQLSVFLRTAFSTAVAIYVSCTLAVGVALFEFRCDVRHCIVNRHGVR
jgi:hypothetical protein